MFTDGNVLMKIVFLQVAVAVFIIFVLKKLLERELFMSMLEKVAHLPTLQGECVDDIVVVAGGKLTGDEEFRLRMTMKEKFPQADVTVGEDRSLWGGVVLRAGDHVFDFSLRTKIGQLLKFSNT